MAEPGPRSAELLGRAERVMPGGVSSPVRAFQAVGGRPFFVESGEGAWLRDLDGRRYLDYVQSYGASILGHAHPRVVDAVSRAAQAGTTFGTPTEREVLLAEAMRERVPGCEELRLTSSGTEAAMSAVRLARGYTGRDRVVKFAGCYHGHSDGLLAGGGSGVASLGLPGSAGVTRASVSETLVVPYNVVPDLGDDVACVIVEPVAANMGLVPPEPGFLEGLRAACDRSGALLVFDEVITGFRVSRGGASALAGVTPDMWCFGKVIGGGLPVGAFGGRRQVMELLAPAGPVYQAGTLSGNPLATAAGLAVLEVLDDAVYESISGYVAELSGGLRRIFSEAGVEAQVPAAGTLMGVQFCDSPVRDYAGARAAAAGPEYASFFASMLEQGVFLAPSAYESVFVSAAHGRSELDRTLEAARAAARAVLESRGAAARR
jgi:glutamate-1-semialdehyde 2,1-aminomutase